MCFGTLQSGFKYAAGQRTFLPLVDIVQHRSGDVTDGSGRVMSAKHAFYKPGYIPGAHAGFVHLDHIRVPKRE